MTTCFTNARVFTGTRQTADAFVVCKGRFVFVGSGREALNLYPDAKQINLNGQFVCAGFNDSHMHLLNLGVMLRQAQLSPASDSLSHVLRVLKAYAQTHDQEPWIIGRGWNQDDFEDEVRYPTRDDLDRVCPDKPCLITRACGHVAIANSAALRMVGIAEQAPWVDGGRVVTDELGRPNGILEENAIDLVTDAMPTPNREQIKSSLLLAMAHVNRFGITSVQSDDFTSTKAPFEEVIAAYLELEREGKMTVRVTQQCLLPDAKSLNRFLKLGYCTGWGDAWFRIGPLKLITDGSLGSRTAFLRKPYEDAPHTCGIATYSQESLDELVFMAHQAGMQIAAHAIGDGAAERVLLSIERAQKRFPRKDARHGIVHAQILTQEQIEKMQALNMHAYIQPIFLDYDTTIVYPRLGSRAQEAYPAATLLRKGVTLSAGSDSPVEPPDVMLGLQCAVTRLPVTRTIPTPYLPVEALSLREALLSFTAYGAYPSFEETSKGLIAEGMLADFTILGIDPFETDPKWIHRIPIQSVYVNGNQVL